VCKPYAGPASAKPCVQTIRNSLRTEIVACSFQIGLLRLGLQVPVLAEVSEITNGKLNSDIIIPLRLLDSQIAYAQET
jgi:hypothetical protein